MGGGIPFPSSSFASLFCLSFVSEAVYSGLALNCQMSLPILFKTSSSVGSFLSMKTILDFNSLFYPNPLSNREIVSGCFFLCAF
jgi:hypothetical protein